MPPGSSSPSRSRPAPLCEGKGGAGLLTSCPVVLALTGEAAKEPTLIEGSQRIHKRIVRVHAADYVGCVYFGSAPASNAALGNTSITALYVRLVVWADMPRRRRPLAHAPHLSSNALIDCRTPTQAARRRKSSGSGSNARGGQMRRRGGRGAWGRVSGAGWLAWIRTLTSDVGGQSRPRMAYCQATDVSAFRG